MALLHIQVRAQAQQPDGSKIEIPPRLALQQAGPRVQVNLKLADQIAAQLTTKGVQVEPPVTGYALIDTGASTTCIDNQAATRLKLPVVNVVNMCSASHSNHKANVYPVRLEMVGFPIAVNIAMAIGAELAAQGIIALIGRDFLANCCLVYNGGVGDFTLAM